MLTPAANTAIGRIIRWMLETLSNSMLFSVLASPEEIWMDKLQKEQLREALNHLTPVQARRIYAYFMLRISIPKIAQSEGVSVSATCHSIHGGLKNLKRYYQKHYHQEKMDEIEAFK